ncbi:MAG TPA: cysteine hydrolase [Candidatus Methylomirabilis sp.]|nr:cysteine hydrolase [Candidatus Methylomirabilis sp.]
MDLGASGRGERTALLLLDFQADFLEAAGRLPVAQEQVPPMLEAANRLIDAAPDLGLEVVYVGNEFSRWDLPANWFRHHASLAGSPGAHLDRRLHVVNDRYFPKQAGNAFRNRDLDTFLRSQGVGRVILAGVFAHACVQASARGALRRGYRVAVLQDGVATTSDRRRSAALHRMHKLGAEIVTSKHVITCADGSFGRPRAEGP